MKIVAIADTHTFHEAVTVPDGDVLIHAGDMTISGSNGELANFLSWFSDLPHKQKIIIPGNHDFYFERKERIAREMVAAAGSNIKLLINESFMYEDIHFYGSPVTPWFMDWAYNVQPHHISEYWNMIPIDTDVLITHGPAFGILDQANPRIPFSSNLGCPTLLGRIQESVQPRVHIFGHIHGSSGIKQVGSTLHVNASVCTEAYKPDNPAREIEL